MDIVQEKDAAEKESSAAVQLSRIERDTEELTRIEQNTKESSRVEGDIEESSRVAEDGSGQSSNAKLKSRKRKLAQKLALRKRRKTALEDGLVS